MSPVYENVIVPFDGTLPGRAALAPAADLAWRCGARIVIVNNTEVHDVESRSALKSRAMSLSGADVDFWVDTQHDLGDALVEATKFRSHPMICIAIRGKQGGLRKKLVLPAIAEQVLGNTDVPVLVIGPNCDVSRGLPMVEVVASLDGSPGSEEILRAAIDWARMLKLKLILVGVVAESSPGPHTGEIEYLRAHAVAAQQQVPQTTFEIIKAKDPTSGLVDYMQAHDDAILAMTTHGRSPGKGILGSVALGVVANSPRAVLFVRTNG